ncbi:hypothetical protein PIB30_068551 [Stylosanthes scabra]|uniref:Replication factor A C-terminal domain-containing protein n=1 Tax=Stylosanthes scabra TaxID=79078 RepID=A0ABU6YPB6_9FABA|nr:hypothetical protein [Stylosanthes scabra]
MTTSYDPIKCIVYSELGDDKVWRTKTRIMRLWKIPSKFDKSKSAYVEMVLIDDEDQFETQFLDDLHDHQATEYVFILQFAKFNRGIENNCVTVGTVKDFTSGKSWWYKGCNNHPNAVKENVDTYKCPNCQWKAETFTPKYALNLKVADEDSCASFIMYEIVGSDYLNISASDLRTKHIMRVSVKLENLNSFQSVYIIVRKLCHDDSIINSFIKKYNLEQASFLPDVSDMTAVQADYSRRRF